MAGLFNELARKSVHIGIGLFAFLLRWLSPLEAAGIAAIALLFNIVLLHRLTGGLLLRDSERKRNFSLGIVLYPAVVLALVVVFHQRLELAAAVWALLAFGDGFATIAGVLLRGPKLPWNPDKSWSGLIAFVAWGTAMSALLIRWTQAGVLKGGESAWVGKSFLDSAGADQFQFLVGACLVVSIIAAFVESLPTGIDDNLLVPIVGGACLYAATLVDPTLLSSGDGWVRTTWLIGAGINLVLAVAAFAAKSVSVSGAVWGWALGTALYGFGGWQAFLTLAIFFFLGTLTTKLGYKKKAALGIAQEKGGRRGAKNAFANTTTGVVFAFLSAATGDPTLFAIGVAAAFATACCDTCSSEIGQAYGKHHYLVTNFRSVKAGTDGAVSLEGTLGGLVGAAILAAGAWATGYVTPVGAAVVTAAAFIGATAESYLGATVESVKLLDNELVNFANTLIGALVGIGLYALVR